MKLKSQSKFTPRIWTSKLGPIRVSLCKAMTKRCMTNYSLDNRNSTAQGQELRFDKGLDLSSLAERWKPTSGQR